MSKKGIGIAITALIISLCYYVLVLRCYYVLAGWDALGAYIYSLPGFLLWATLLEMYGQFVEACGAFFPEFAKILLSYTGYLTGNSDYLFPLVPLPNAILIWWLAYFFLGKMMRKRRGN